MAGEVVAVCEDVKLPWVPGDRVCANFYSEYQAGEPHAGIMAGALGGPTQGVLSEYVLLPAYVSQSHRCGWLSRLTEMLV